MLSVGLFKTKWLVGNRPVIVLRIGNSLHQQVWVLFICKTHSRIGLIKFFSQSEINVIVLMRKVQRQVNSQTSLPGIGTCKEAAFYPVFAVDSIFCV